MTGFHDDSESEEDTPSFVDYDAAVVAEKVPLDFLVSNTAFLAGCLCYDVTTVAR